MKLEDIEVDAHVDGLVPGQAVQIVQVKPVGADACNVTYRDGAGVLAEQLVFRAAAAELSLVEHGRPWALTGDGADFKLAAEAYRIQLAHLFDPMMAVHTSDIIPLPHQLTAVYESMLPKQPLRYVLADDPGAGKTIMAGLLIRELMARSDAERILVVSPGSLTEQWQDELWHKFGVEFQLYSREMLNASHTGNPFQEHDRLIVRLDQLSRSLSADDEPNTPLEDLILESDWDLIIFDEAHKLSAHYYGSKVEKTKRYRLAEALGARTRHLLLMTATPHNGKEEDFQLFLALLDSDRFYGKFRDGAHQVDTDDLMRRMVKEELVKFDGTPLFPERLAYTVTYDLSDAEAALYADVTAYVREQMNAADNIGGRRRGSVGLALTVLQRRLASSPEAIYQSLHRRRKKLEARLREAKLDHRGLLLTDHKVQDLVYDDDDLDEMTGDEREAIEEEVVDEATSARTVEELEKEVELLKALEAEADAVRASGVDRKWNELSALLQDNPEMYRADGSRRKIILFTEHKDTLAYLADQIRGLLGSQDAVQVIYGGTPREERRKIQERFRSDPDVLVLVATDAAGEGVNLQTANLMVNYDLPWNPNRLEQRFGRIHRIGQQEVCHLWNLVAAETREGDVFQRLFEKLEVERKALKGRVFDVLGELFENHSLRDLLLEAIRYGEDPAVKNKLFEQVDRALDHDHVMRVVDRGSLTPYAIPTDKLYAIKAEMERAEARRLQPRYIYAFFQQAFDRAGGELLPREHGRFEIRHVPAVLRRRDRLTGAKEPVLTKYERVCFEKDDIHVPGKAQAALVHPAHPLMAALIDETLLALRPTLQSGAVLVNELDPGATPRVLFVLDHAIREGGDPDRHASRRLQLVEIDESGEARSGGAAAYLDYRPLASAEHGAVQELLDADWLGGEHLEAMAMSYAAEHLVPAHLAEVKGRREAWVDKTLAAVHERLVKEIYYQQDLLEKVRRDVAAGKQPRVQEVNKERLLDDLQERLRRRTTELQAQRHVSAGMPTVAGVALVVPQGWLDARLGGGETKVDAAARKRIEQAAMKAVMDAERALGFEPRSVESENCGWDVESRRPDGSLRFIEVKGRHAQATTVTVSRNEILQALNTPDRFFLAVVRVDGDATDGPHYVHRPFTAEPEPTVNSINYALAPLLARAVAPEATRDLTAPVETL